MDRFIFYPAQLKYRALYFLLTVLFGLLGCSIPTEPPSAQSAEGNSESSVQFYIDKLPDKSFIDYYGGEEHPRIWYRAAEELGQFGKEAIPLLIERLDSEDSYEVMLALYALMLASQDSAVMAETHGDYVQLGTVLTESTNESNRVIALAWWQTHKHLWDK